MVLKKVLLPNLLLIAIMFAEAILSVDMMFILFLLIFLLFDVFIWNIKSRRNASESNENRLVDSN